MDVLIVEDDEPVMRLIGWALKVQGRRTGTATTPDEAAEQALASQPRVVIFNTCMSVTDKRACIQELREAVRGVRVIDLVTGDRRGSADTGADAYVFAPLYPDRVIDAVDEVLREAPRGVGR